MRLYVSYIPYATSSREQTSNIIMLVQFEEGDLLSETRDDAEISDESNENLVMPPLISKEEMDAMDSGNKYDYEPMSTEMLEDICGFNKSHPGINRREECHKIRNCIKQRQKKWKRELLS